MLYTSILLALQDDKVMNRRFTQIINSIVIQINVSVTSTVIL